MIVNAISETELKYETPGACAFDLKSNWYYMIWAWKMVTVDTWVVIQVPEGYMLQVSARSSTFKKTDNGLILVNSIWVIDQDYHGPEDTIKLQFLNLWDKTVNLLPEQRIAQWVFVKIEKAEFHYCEKIKEENRWWIGSTWI